MILLSKFNCVTYGLPTIQLEVLNIRRHLFKVSTRGKGHCTDGRHHLVNKNSDFLPFLLFFNYVWNAWIGGGTYLIWLDKGLSQDSSAIGLRFLSYLEQKL